MPLIATRHNGVPTIAAAAVFVLMTGRRHWRQAAALTTVAAGAAVITFAATKASGNANAMDPIQTVEWLMGDISCMLGRGGVEPTEGEWATLTRIAGRDEWPQLRACRVMNPILIERLANESAIVANYGELIGVWRSLLARYPIEMIAAHATRVRLFLPPVRRSKSRRSSIRRSCRTTSDSAGRFRRWLSGLAWSSVPGMRWDSSGEFDGLVARC